MRKIWACLMCVFLLAGCGADRPGEAEYMVSEAERLGLDLNARSTVQEESTELALSTEWAEYDPSVGTIWFTLENHSGAEIETGVDYALERYVEEAVDWYQISVKDNVGWNAVALCVPDGETVALSCALSVFDYDFSAGGIYRIVKTAEGQTCTAEFRLTPGAAVSAETPYGFEPLESLPAEYGAAIAADTDVVFTWDNPRNIERVEEFLKKVRLEIPCQLRTVQDYGEGLPMVIDAIFENNNFLWRMWSDGTVTEQRFSYLVTDGDALYLANGVDMEHTVKYDGAKAFLIPEQLRIPELNSMAAEMAAARLAGSSVRYRVWSADGIYSAALTDAPTVFLVDGQGRGETFDLQDWDGLETAISGIAWQEDGTLRLTCETITGEAGTLRFDPETWKLGG